ncbi:MAG: DUF465 domain-containing protein [Candidatus Binatia bacterium]
MEPSEEQLIESLAQENAELKSAYEEHRRLKVLVKELTDEPHLTVSQQMRRKDLKKRKLAQKDKIMKILAEYRRGQAERQQA